MALMGVSTRNARRACRLSESGVPEGSGAGLTKSSVSRRFKALTQMAFEEWMAGTGARLGARKAMRAPCRSPKMRARKGNA